MPSVYTVVCSFVLQPSLVITATPGGANYLTNSTRHPEDGECCAMHTCVYACVSLTTGLLCFDTVRCDSRLPY